MRSLILALLMCFVIPGFTQDTSSINVRDLPKEKQLQLAQQAEQMRKETSNGSILAQDTTPEQVSKWLGLGKEVADLIPIFAEKTGIAADKVLNSFSGKVLLSIVLVHFFWAKLIGILILTVGVFIWWKFFQNMFLIESKEQVIHPNPLLGWMGIKKTLKKMRPFTKVSGSEGDSAWLAASLILLVATLISGFVMVS